MRVTQQSLQRQLQAGIRARQQAMVRAQNQAISGRRVGRMSDDPVSGAQIMRLGQLSGDLEQLRRNGDLVSTRLSAEGVALKTLRDSLDAARDVAMGTASDDPNDPARLSGLAKAQALREQILGLANTRVGSEYIFAGSRTDRPAYASDGTYQGDANVRLAEIQDGVTVPVGHPGEPLFGDALRALDNLIQQLQTGTQDDVQGTVPAITAASHAALTAETESGVWSRDITTANQSLALTSAQYLERRDALRDVDPAEAILALQSEQSALERAYAVVSRVMQASLTDYLR